MRLTLRDDGIVYAEVKPLERSPTGAEVAEDLEALVGLAGRVPRPTVWDLRSFGFRLPGGTWRNIIEQLPDTALAVAIIVADEAAANLGTFPEAIDSFLMPLRIFSDEADAWEWITEQASGTEASGP